MSKIPVYALYEYCEMMLHDGWGYIWGTAGVKCTQAVINKAIERHPSTADITKKYGPKWLGRMVTDCSGVMVYIWHQFDKSIPHGSSKMVREGYIVDCSATPHPGYAALVDPTPETDDNNHIGIVSEDGKYVYEAKGTQYGFVKTALTKAKFNKFGRFADVDYEATQGGGQMEPFTQYLAIVDTKKDPLNVREKPNTSSKILFKVPKGSTVWVMEETGTGWARIDDDGMQGYASMQYLKAAEAPSEPPEEPDDKTPTPPAQPPKNAILCGVWIPCGSEEEAEWYAGNIKGAIIIRADKPPDAEGE